MGENTWLAYLNQQSIYKCYLIIDLFCDIYFKRFLKTHFKQLV